MRKIKEVNNTITVAEAAERRYKTIRALLIERLRNTHGVTGIDVFGNLPTDHNTIVYACDAKRMTIDNAAILIAGYEALRR